VLSVLLLLLVSCYIPFPTLPIYILLHLLLLLLLATIIVCRSSWCLRLRGCSCLRHSGVGWRGRPCSHLSCCSKGC
jgi:hypothetical protein